MNSPDQDDIKQRFQALKREVEMRTPNFADTWGAATGTKRPVLVAGRLRNALIAAVAAVAIAGMLLWPRSAGRELLQSLPPLFAGPETSPSGEFLAFAAPEQRPAWPSDSLFPQHINLINP